MEKELYAVIMDDIDAGDCHYVPGDILHIEKLLQLARETGGPINCTIILGFDAACEWSEEGF